MCGNLSPAEDEESIVLDTGTVKEVSDALGRKV